jgi:hypothetical protein
MSVVDRDDRVPNRRARPARRLVASALAAGLAAMVVLLLAPGPDVRLGSAAGAAIGPPPVWAASPVASPAAGGDTRSPGEGPGLVGSPGLAIGGVLALGLAAAALTLLYVRATGGPRPPP